MQDYHLLFVNDHAPQCAEAFVILKFICPQTMRVNPDKLPQYTHAHDKLTAIVVCDTGHDVRLTRLIEQIHGLFVGTPVILLSEQAQGTCCGVDATVSMPLSQQELLHALKQCQAQRKRLQSMPAARFSGQSAAQSIVGTSQAMRVAKNLINQVATHDVNVLLLGESGTGKELAARSIHAASNRGQRPFVAINCAAIPFDLLEAELFGHEKGAFTGAYTTRKGRFELAQGGTLFLDEIGDMPLVMQVKLLRVLQERCFERVGGSQSIAADVRVIAATHVNLEQHVEEGKFREDLYYRLNVFPIQMPALRDHIDDLPQLLSALLAQHTQAGTSIQFNAEAMACLQAYTWPGNVRECANLVERLSVMFPGQCVTANHLPEKYRLKRGRTASMTTTLFAHVDTNEAFSTPTGVDLRQLLAETEKHHIQQALDVCGGVVAHAADYLHMRRTTLVEKMRKYKVTREVA